MKKVSAEWNAELYVSCPHCNGFNYIDFTKIDDWWCCFGNVCESTEGVDYVHKCDECGKEFMIDKTVW